MVDVIQWAAFDRNGRMCEWIGTRRTKAEVIPLAVQGLMPATEYDRIGNDSDRWNYCYRRGCRIKRVRLVPSHGEADAL